MSNLTHHNTTQATSTTSFIHFYLILMFLACNFGLESQNYLIKLCSFNFHLISY